MKLVMYVIHFTTWNEFYNRIRGIGKILILVFMLNGFVILWKVHSDTYIQSMEHRVRRTVDDSNGSKSFNTLLRLQSIEKTIYVY